MIRDFHPKDTDQIMFLKNSIDTSYEVDDISYIQSNATTFIVFEQERLKGFAYAIMIDNDAGDTEAQIRVYVEPNSRNEGIGSALYNKLEKLLVGCNPDILSAYIRVDIINPALFCNKMGFNKWWGSPELIYKGEKFPDVELEFCIYEDKFFERYVKVTQESYYDLHKNNDLKPYIVSKEIITKYKLNNKQNVYLALQDEQIMVSVTIGDGTIENLMVSPSYQGRGYGKMALQFGINKLINQGYGEIRICYMEGNTIAEKLYTNLGFKPLYNTHVYRKFIR